MIAHAIVAAAGIWLMAAPAVLGYDGAAATNDRISGPTIAAFAIIAMAQVTRPLRWINVALGVWVMASPIVLGSTGAARANSVVVGAAITLMSLVRGTLKHRYGGGWRSLIGDDARPTSSSRP